MRIDDLIDLRGVKEKSDFRTFDFAVPMNRGEHNFGTYPCNGRAISVYYTDRVEILSYEDLAHMAVLHQERKLTKAEQQVVTLTNTVRDLALIKVLEHDLCSMDRRLMKS